MVWVLSLSTTDLIIRSPTPALSNVGIRSLVGVGRRKPPSPSSALPPTFNTPG